MKKALGIYGASGFGREVMGLAKKQMQDKESALFFIDDNINTKTENGCPVITFEEFASLPTKKKQVCLGIADYKIRKLLFSKLEENNIDHWSIYADNSLQLDECEIGENSILCPFVTITSNIKIGKSFHANLYSYVGHDCIIGDFVTFAPGVQCNGNIHIESDVYIGSGAIIKQGKQKKPLIIGKGAIIGMGAIITKDVPPGATVIASPSKPLERKGLGR